jgi:hypothetical protein
MHLRTIWRLADSKKGIDPALARKAEVHMKRRFGMAGID